MPGSAETNVLTVLPLPKTSWKLGNVWADFCEAFGHTSGIQAHLLERNKKGDKFLWRKMFEFC